MLPKRSCVRNLVPRFLCYRCLEVGPLELAEGMRVGPHDGSGGFTDTFHLQNQVATRRKVVNVRCGTKKPSSSETHCVSEGVRTGL